MPEKNLRFLVYNVHSGICTNVILWDGLRQFRPNPGEAREIVPAGSRAGIGWRRVRNGVWDEPPPPPPPEPEPEPEPVDTPSDPTPEE